VFRNFFLQIFRKNVSCSTTIEATVEVSTDLKASKFLHFSVDFNFGLKVFIFYSKKIGDMFCLPDKIF